MFGRTYLWDKACTLLQKRTNIMWSNVGGPTSSRHKRKGSNRFEQEINQQQPKEEYLQTRCGRGLVEKFGN
jgi:hypothetical protein